MSLQIKTPRTIAALGVFWWRLLDSNQWPHAHEGCGPLSVVLSVVTQL